MNEEFVSLCAKVEGDLQAGDFTAAAAKARFLPKRTVLYDWDESNVPASRRAEFRDARDQAIEIWTSTAGLNLKQGSPPDIRFTFVSDLPSETAEDIPGGARFEFSTDPGSPRLIATIGLHRMKPEQPVDVADVHNEVAYALGQYIGLERWPSFGTVMTRTDESTKMTVEPSPVSNMLALEGLQVADQLRSLVANKTKIDPAFPKIRLDASAVTGIAGAQGEELGFDVNVHNDGNAPLLLDVRPDCGCLRPMPPTPIAPGKSSIIRSSVDTVDFTGHLHHELFIYSNDPLRPLIDMPVQLDIEPLYHFYQPGASVVQVDKNGADVDLYLILSKNAKFKVLAAIAGGPARADVRLAHWEGELKESPEDSAVQESGYKLSVHVYPGSLPGRIPISITLTTDSDEFRVISHVFQVQHGIVALPGSIYLGNIGHEQRHLSFLVSRPGVPFKIAKVVCNSPNLTAHYTPVKGDEEYRVDVQFDGQAGFGKFDSSIDVYTDDSGQPIVKLPVQGVIQ